MPSVDQIEILTHRLPEGIAAMYIPCQVSRMAAIFSPMVSEIDRNRLMDRFIRCKPPAVVEFASRIVRVEKIEPARERVPIGGRDLAAKEWAGQRVVTFQDIDDVHQRPEGTAGRSFREHRERFIEGVDFFRLTYQQAKATNFVELSSPNGLILLTESGYLMLVKSFTDDMAWRVQRELVNTYFRAKAGPPAGRSSASAIAAIESMLAVLKDHDARIAQAEEKADRALREAAGIRQALLRGLSE